MLAEKNFLFNLPHGRRAQEGEKMCQGKKKIALTVLFLLYLCVLFYLLLFAEALGRHVEHPEYRYNLILFQEIRRFWTYRNSIGFEGVFLNLAGNVLAFMPFGFGLPYLWIRKKEWLLVFLLSAGLSFVMESLQFLLRVGSFDVDDLLLNTLGGLLGYGCFCLYRHHNRKRSSGKKNGAKR